MNARSGIFGTLIAVHLVLTQHALAGGSVPLDDLREMLAARRAEWRAMKRIYEIEQTGDATRFGRHWTHLGGGRCGPYEFRARNKGSGEGYTHSIVIETTITFFDSKGRPLSNKPNPTKAARFKERITAIRAVPYQAANDGRSASRAGRSMLLKRRGLRGHRDTRSGECWPQTSRAISTSNS